MVKVRNLTRCRACQSRRLYQFLDLGEMPIPNGFLKKEELKKPEEKFELAVFYCRNCGFFDAKPVCASTRTKNCTEN